MEGLIPYLGCSLVIVVVAGVIIGLHKHGIRVKGIKHKDTEVEFGEAGGTDTEVGRSIETAAIMKAFNINGLIEQLGDAREEIGELRNENRHLRDFKALVMRFVERKMKKIPEAVSMVAELLNGDLSGLEEYLESARGQALLVEGTTATDDDVKALNDEIVAVEYVQGYYGNTTRLDRVRRVAKPGTADLAVVLEIIKDDAELNLYFYDKLDSAWLELLDGAGEFAGLGKENTGIVEHKKALYIAECADSKPKVVLEIIKKVKAKNWAIQGALLKAVVKMPEDIAVLAISEVIEYLAVHKTMRWYYLGERSAELTVKLVGSHPNEAFGVAEALFDAWVSEDGSYKNIVAKFSGRDYRKLVLEHYSKVWEVKPGRAIGVLVKILNRCLETLDKDGKGEEGYDASRFFGYGLELGDLNEIDMEHPSIRTVLVKEICEAGRVLIDKEPEKVSDLLDMLEGTGRVIFLRIAMYLLRFVQEDTEIERIRKFTGNGDFFSYGNPYWNEHRWLLNDKFDEAGEEVRERFVAWIEEPKVTSERKKEREEWCRQNNKPLPDFEKWESQEKAEELYLVREKFKELYEEHQRKSGLKDAKLAPRKMVSDARWVSPTEGSPLSGEKMAKRSCDAVLDYLLEPKNYESKEKVSGWGTAKDTLAETFRYDVKKRVGDYLECDVEKLAKLGSHFLSRFFYGFSEAEKVGRKLWGQVLELASEVVKRNGIAEGYRTCYSAILSVLRDGFSDKADDGIEFNEERVKKFWGIIETLAGYPVGDMRSSEGPKQDPVQTGCNLVPGQASELSVSLVVVCKKHFSKLYEEYLRERVRKCYETLLSEIKTPGVNYMFGSNFARIYWTDSKWVKQNLGNIFSKDLWDETWGTYVSWGRPSPQCFELLVREGLYLKAVEKIGSKKRFKFGKEPDEGLVEHLMVGYFNGWIEYEDKDKVLHRFFERASVDLRAKAAQFLTTGFKSVNEEEKSKKEKVAERMRKYWESRLAVMEKDAGGNKEEAIGFVEWMSDSVLGGKETLELMERTLTINGGKLDKYGDAKGFADGVTKLCEGNELLALRCLKLAANDENMHEPWSDVQGPLVEFLKGLPKEVWGEGIEVADLYGRYNPDAFRGVWEKLKG